MFRTDAQPSLRLHKMAVGRILFVENDPYTICTGLFYVKRPVTLWVFLYVPCLLCIRILYGSYIVSPFLLWGYLKV